MVVVSAVHVSCGGHCFAIVLPVGVGKGNAPPFSLFVSVLGLERERSGVEW